MSQVVAVVAIQRWYRKMNSYGIDCPISMEPIRYPCWGFKSGSKRHYYNVPVIVDYFIERKDFRDPMTKTPLEVQDIEEIDSIVQNNNLNLDIKQAYRNRVDFQIDQEYEDRISILEDTIRETVNDILDDLEIIENVIRLDEDLDVNELLSTKTIDLRIYLNTLDSICCNTYQYMLEWSKAKLEDYIPEYEIVDRIKLSIIHYLDVQVEWIAASK